MAARLVRSAMERRVYGGRKKRWRGNEERDTENEMQKEKKIER